MPISPPLSVGWGYGIVLGLGAVFAFGMILVTWVLKRYNNELQTSEMFSTAGRTVKSGLVASAVVSSWTWAATLLQSSGIAYRYGVSGPFWYASGATVQILLFATIAIELKRRAPNAHTFLEVIRARYGTYAHITFTVFGLMTNILVTAMLLTGGSAVVSSLTGMPTPAACFLLPLGVVMYTMFGGIKATFLTDWVHTFILLIIIIIFSFTTYATSPLLGSPSKVFDLLVQAAADHPVKGNAGGSYLTMKSTQGAIFFVINIVGNFGTVFLDNGYYNKAIAASPVHALPGYIMGGISWFAIPWLMATTCGLAALALEGNPAFPTYPNRMLEADVSAGLVVPYAAVALLGGGGAVAVLLIVFMAVTSASSAELIAVSSIFTYDIYQTYFNPAASGKKLIYMSHAMVISFGLFMAAFSTGLYYAGISMGYLYVMMGVIISSAVIPATLTIMWAGHNAWAATLTPPLGLGCALIAWLVTAKKTCGSLTVECTGSNNPMLAGNVMALLSPLIFTPLFTLIFGVAHYDWASMMAIRRGDDHDLAASAQMDLELVPGETSHSANEEAVEQSKLLRASNIAKITTVVLTLALLILWPMPMYGTGYIFSKDFFAGWVVVGIIWIFGSLLCVGVYPVFEGRKDLWFTMKAIYLDITGKKHPSSYHTSEATYVEGKDAKGDGGVGTPPSKEATIGEEKIASQ
ncbi:putative urea active transporter [Lachnellula subtilissima]|uniref:Putative urea active transporter n=1 Tax=Lachnellula subtilissima TaxID=602034 RepID=A0A8H8RWU1_9HELO|nr:putative urea active transporter [Lachnellula subtilissima]